MEGKAAKQLITKQQNTAAKAYCDILTTIDTDWTPWCPRTPVTNQPMNIDLAGQYRSLMDFFKVGADYKLASEVWFGDSPSGGIANELKQKLFQGFPNQVPPVPAYNGAILANIAVVEPPRGPADTAAKRVKERKEKWTALVTGLMVTKRADLDAAMKIK